MILHQPNASQRLFCDAMLLAIADGYFAL